MITTIWVLKVFIAMVFTFTGIFKIFLPKGRLLAKGMKGLVDLDEKQIKLVGFLEVLGAIGLIFPSLLNIFPMLSVISAFCLALTMIVGGWVNYKLRLPTIPNVLIFFICILITILELKYL